jgi:hypothetical protein
VYTFRFGTLTSSLKSNIPAPYPHVTFTNRADCEKILQKHETTIHDATLFYFKQSVQYLNELQGGIDVWLTPAQRSALLQTLFDQAPVTICANAFPIENQSIDFATMFQSDSAECVKWQKACGYKYAVASELHQHGCANVSLGSGTWLCTPSSTVWRVVTT